MIAITSAEAVGKLESTGNYNEFAVRDEDGNYNNLSQLYQNFTNKVVKITIEVISHGNS